MVKQSLMNYSSINVELENEGNELRHPEFEQLAKIRDTEPSARNTAGGGAALKDVYELFISLRRGATANEAQVLSNKAQLLRQKAFESRKRMWGALSYRYLRLNSDFAVQGLTKATSHGIGSPEFISLAYLYYSLRDVLTFKFITEVVWDKWQRQITNVDTNDFLLFHENEAVRYPQIKKWRESTRRKLATNVLSALRDFGLLKGAQRKHIQRPPVAPETIYHLLAILVAEGKQGRAIIEAPDWRLFLWDEADVSRAMGDLAQKRWIRYEKAGKVVILQMIRMPEVSGESSREAHGE